MRVAGMAASGRTTLGDLPAQTWWNLVNVFGRDMGGVFVPAFLRGPNESGEEVVSLGASSGPLPGSMGGATATMVIAFVLSAFVLTGYVSAAREHLTAAELLVPLSLALTVAVPFQTFRYVLPLTPFLFFYLIEGVRRVTVWCGRAMGAVPRRSMAGGEDRDAVPDRIRSCSITRNTSSMRATRSGRRRSTGSATRRKSTRCSAG